MTSSSTCRPAGDRARSGPRSRTGGGDAHLDRGTVGLGGPTTRGSSVSAVASDFVDFVFNMEQPRDVAWGRGTYGFGKTITYIVSEASTAILYTRTRVEAELESRLIGAAVGTPVPDRHASLHRTSLVGHK